MRRLDILRRAGKSLGQAKARTILTSLAIAVGATTICLAMAAGNGARDYIDDMVKDRGDDGVLMVYRAFESESETTNRPRKVDEPEKAVQEVNRYSLTEDDRQKITDISGVKQVVSEVSIFLDSVEGIDGQYEGSVSSQIDERNVKYLTETAKNYQLKKGEIAIPEMYLEVIGVKDANDAIGKKIVLNFTKDDVADSEDDDVFQRELRIIAVISGESPAYGSELLISQKDGEEIYSIQRSDEAGYYSVLLVKAEDGVNVTDIKNEVIELGGYSVYSMMDMKEDMFATIKVAQYGLIGFGMLAVLASIFGIINTQYISVLERTQQIGLMKALGCKRKDISKLFRYEAAWIGLLGGLIGVGVAFAITLLNPFIAGFLELEEGTRLLRTDAISSAVLVAALMIIAVLAGYFPSRKAAKLNPIEALRTE